MRQELQLAEKAASSAQQMVRTCEEFARQGRYDELMSHVEGFAGTPDGELERRLLYWRIDGGRENLAAAAAPAPRPSYPNPFPGVTDQAPEVRVADLTPEILGGCLAHQGHVLVRGLFDRDEALALGDAVDRSLSAYKAEIADPAAATMPWFERFSLPGKEQYIADRRWWIELEGFSVFAVDSPRSALGLVTAYRRSGIVDVIEAYLGEHPIMSSEKSTMRKLVTSEANSWHQDAAVLGLETRAVNIWTALTRAGDDAPGFEYIPRPFHDLVPQGTEGAPLEWCVSPKMVDEVRGDLPIATHVFEPGDCLLFNQFSLHQTRHRPQMTKPRMSVESWFFAPSTFPEGHIPVAI